MGIFKIIFKKKETGKRYKKKKKETIDCSCDFMYKFDAWLNCLGFFFNLIPALTTVKHSVKLYPIHGFHITNYKKYIN